MRISPPRRLALAAVLPLVAAAAGLRAQSPAPADTAAGRGRVGEYLHDVASPGAVGPVLGMSVFDQLRDDPDGWDANADGLGRRAASRYGQLLAGETARHGIAAALGRTTEEVRCRCDGIARRFAHGVAEAVTDRDVAGRRRISEARIAGSYASAVAPLAWNRPGHGLGDALRDGTLSLLFSALGNGVLEIFRGGPGGPDGGTPPPARE